MIFLLRLIIFSFFIILGFRISLRSKNFRAVVSVIYGAVLLYYTFLIRVRFSVDVSASDYGHAVKTSKSVAEEIWSIIDYSGPSGATCPEFESHHSGE